MTASASSRSWLKRGTFVAALLGVLALVIVGFRALLEGESATMASFPVRQGEFVITLILKDGELEAVEAEQINAPNVHGNLKITHLFPEGETVDVGDLIVEFDKVEFEKQVLEAEQALQAAHAELSKTVATQKVEIARQESDIENKEAELKLAQLQIERMEFEASLQRQESQLQARQAELAVEQAHKQLEAQRVVDEAERTKQNLDVSQKERGLEKAHKDFESLSMYAEQPGLVVYKKLWKGGQHEKLRVGDEPWGGAVLITLPDLSLMQVQTFVNEVDVDKLEVGLKATIKLDALPEPTFHGTISSIDALGHEKEGDKNVKVFNLVIELDGTDERLKPGMSASAEVVIETIPAPADTLEESEVVPVLEQGEVALPLYIPLDAVFEKGGRTLVYRLEGSTPAEQEVVLGKRNDNYVIVEEGLAADDRVTLRDPTLVLEDLGGIPKERVEKSEESAHLASP